MLPAEVSEAAQVLATRFEPEVFVPPLPGTPVRRAAGAERDEALFFDGMERRLPAGLSRDDEPLYLDLDFLDGTRGAHVNISGHLRRGHEDQLRDVPPLLPVRVRRARRRGRQHQGPRLQREGRGPAVAGPPEPAAGRAAGRPLRPGRPPGRRVPERRLLRATPARRAHAGARRRQPRPRHRRRSSGRSRSSAARSCCRSCSPTPRTTASSTRWSSTTSPPGSGRRRRRATARCRSRARWCATSATSSTSSSPA